MSAFLVPEHWGKGIFLGGGGVRPWQAGEAWSPEATREISRNQGSELSDDTIVPQGDAVTDMIRRENKLILMPGNAAGTATPVGIRVCYCSTRLKAEVKTSVCHALGKRNSGRLEWDTLLTSAASATWRPLPRRRRHCFTEREGWVAEVLWPNTGAQAQRWAPDRNRQPLHCTPRCCRGPSGPHGTQAQSECRTLRRPPT